LAGTGPLLCSRQNGLAGGFAPNLGMPGLGHGLAGLILRFDCWHVGFSLPLLVAVITSITQSGRNCKWNLRDGKGGQLARVLPFYWARQNCGGFPVFSRLYDGRSHAVGRDGVALRAHKGKPPAGHADAFGGILPHSIPKSEIVVASGIR